MVRLNLIKIYIIINLQILELLQINFDIFIFMSKVWTSYFKDEMLQAKHYSQYKII